MSTAPFTILIPAFNEEKTIRALVERCLNFTEELLVVDDGSTDSTVERIKDLPITILRNTVNLGKGSSLLKGFAYLQKRNPCAVITMDADAQHNPDDIPYFIQALEAYPNRIIIGARTINTQNAPRYRLLGNRISDFFISWAAGRRIIDTQSGFRLYPSKLIPEIIRSLSRSGAFVFESRVLIDATRKGFTPVFIAIESCYPENTRDSYFRPVVDSSKIFALVAWKLLSRGFCLKGLYSTLFKSAHKIL